MNIRLQPLALRLLLGTAAAILVAGCNPQESASSGESAPVETTMGTELDDTVLTTKVKSALMSDAGIRSGDISVSTRKGEVQLSGFVDSQAQIDRAVIATRSIQGVQLVVNEMSVKQ
jgi:hyperosmotically inducible periplasmic protein